MKKICTRILMVLWAYPILTVTYFLLTPYIFLSHGWVGVKSIPMEMVEIFQNTWRK